MDTAVGRARAGCDHGPGFRRQPINPVAGENWLAGFLVRAKRRPVAFALVFLVGDGAFDYQNKRRQLAFGRLMKHLHELFAVFVSKKWIMQFDLGNKRERPEHKLFETRLRRRGHGDRVTVAAKARSDPQHIDFS